MGVVVKNLILTCIVLFLVGCAPLGYMQSPRVKNGVALGPVGTWQSYPKPYRTDVSYEGEVYVPNNREYVDTIFTKKISGSNVSEGGVSFFYPRIGFLEKVRISGTLYILPMGGFLSGTFCEVMVNIFDRGEPYLFRNMALGAVGNISSVSANGEHRPADAHTYASAGGIVGTHQKLARSELELTLGFGGSRHIYEMGYGHYEGPEPVISTSHLLYTLDFAPAVHWYLGHDRLQFSLGSTFSIPFYDDFWISMSGDNIKSIAITPVEPKMLMKVQAALSWRFMKKEKEQEAKKR